MIRRAARRAFTLLELMLATTIMGVVAIAVFAVFAVGLNAYQEVERDTVVLQRARYIFDVFGDDIARTVYLDETGYNNNARFLIEQYQREMIQAEANNDWRAFEERYAPRRNREEELSDPNFVGNPFDQVRMVDMQFVGIDGGGQDTLTFAVLHPLEAGLPYIPWGVARVQYALFNGVMIRSVETVESAPRSWDGEILEKEDPPDHRIMAEGIVSFDLSYGFWFDHQWYEVDTWSSNDRTIRNAASLMGEYNERELERLSQTIGLGSTDQWNALVNDLENQPLNRLPSYVRMRLVLADPVRRERTKTFQRVFRLPSAKETFLPNEVLDDDQQEMERAARDQEFRMVFPGASRR